MFGWQPKSSDLGEVVTAPCRHCATETPWHLHDVTMWISLFFVRVLPTGSETWLRCAGGCGDGLPLSADRNALIRQGNDEDDPMIVSWVSDHQGQGPHSTSLPLSPDDH